MIPKIIISWFLVLIRCFHSICEYVYHLIYESDYEKVKNLPSMKNGSPLLMESAVDLATKIRNQEPEYSSVALVKAVIERINQVNGTLNAVVDTRFDEALREAKLADELITTTSNDSKEALQRLAIEKPFLGVPFTTKDCFAVKGLSWTAGLLARGNRKEKATFYAEPIKRMCDAGAIPVAVTNVPELCMWMETSNRIYGRTVNPYHPGRICGGSSGGEGSIIASGASIFGIGSDVGGSIRMPSFFNGIFGHKPSTGIVPNGPGQIPVAHGEIDKFLVTGPMCRHSGDLLPILNVLSKPEKLSQLRLNTPVNLRSLKIYYMTDNSGGYLETPIHRDLKNAQMTLVSALEEELGIKVQKVNLRNFHHSFLIWSNMMATEPAQPKFGQDLREVGTDKNGINPFKELVKWCAFKMSDHTFPAIALAIMEKFMDTNAPMHHHFLHKYEELKKELETLLGTDGVLIYPSHPTPAPYHGLPLLRPFNPGYTAIFNVLGNPVTQVPLGLGSWKVPLGVQLVAGVNQDRNTLALAQLVEKLFGGWVEPMYRK